jgi:hypothetical protein
MMAGVTKTKTIRLVGLAAGTPHEMSGQYVVRYDPDYHLPDGSYEGGELICTPRREQATYFDLAAAVLLYRSGPTCTCHRLRPDGMPNRPLTAFTVEIC